MRQSWAGRIRDMTERPSRVAQASSLLLQKPSSGLEAGATFTVNLELPAVSAARNGLATAANLFIFQAGASVLTDRLSSP
jgi:hypothetical protein